MESEILNLDKICRTCKCIGSQMRPLFEKYENVEESARIDEMLMACASVQVSYTDGLPSQICEICVEQLKKAFTFKLQCEKVDANLKEYARNVKVNEIKEELQSTEFMESLNTLSNLLNKGPAKQTNQNTSSAPVTPKLEMDYIQFLEKEQLVLTCGECSKIFSTVRGLKHHKRVHTGNLHKCSKCGKEYSRRHHLRRHEESHNRQKVHVCKICNKMLTRPDHLRRHLTTHLREKPFPCSTCNRMFSRIEHLENHKLKCKGDVVYCCEICNKAFSRTDSLEVHMNMHDDLSKTAIVENLENFESYYYEVDQEANSAFSDLSDDDDDCLEPEVEMTETMDDDSVKEVESINVKDDDNNTTEISIIVEDYNDDDHENGSSMDKVETVEDEQMESPVDVKMEDSLEVEDNSLDDDGTDIRDAGERSGDSTDSEYTPKKSVSPKAKRGRGRPRKHPVKVKVPGRGRGRPATRVKKEKVEELGEYPCPICQEIFHKMSSLDKHAMIKHEGVKIHKCPVCNKEFNRSNHLKRHVTSHSTVKPFQCHLCPKSFNRRDHLNEHRKLHDKTSEVACDICWKMFSRTENLARHKATKHGIGERVPTERKYECPLCLKTFTTEKYRDIHVNGHNGMRDYQCKECQKSFLSKSHLTEHMKFHNDLSKKFLCSECGQRFIRNDYLVIHMRRHKGEKPFKCKFCGKGFPRTTDLTVHERYHTGEKTHLCTICGRGFGRAYNLTVHMRTHTGEKPYQCTYCDAAFAQGNDLKAHVRRHTGERFHCEFCTDSFLMGYLLTQHKRTVHGLNVVSNIRRLQPVNKQENPDDPPPITISLPKPMVPENVMYNAVHLNPVQADSLHAQLALAQFQLARE